MASDKFPGRAAAATVLAVPPTLFAVAGIQAVAWCIGSKARPLTAILHTLRTGYAPRPD